MRKLSVILPAVAAGTLAASSARASEPRTSVVKCQAESCLVVTGRRPNDEAGVSINGHEVSVEGRKKWRVLIPVETVRAWSAPLARSITVSVNTGLGSREFDTRLPIGLLGQPDNLALLEISLK
ncbi:MAG: hypothetical protein ACTHLU_11910 [Novosphingobium sp.]